MSKLLNTMQELIDSHKALEEDNERLKKVVRRLAYPFANFETENYFNEAHWKLKHLLTEVGNLNEYQSGNLRGMFLEATDYYKCKVLYQITKNGGEIMNIKNYFDKDVATAMLEEAIPKAEVEYEKGILAYKGDYTQARQEAERVSGVMTSLVEEMDALYATEVDKRRTTREEADKRKKWWKWPVAEQTLPCIDLFCEYRELIKNTSERCSLVVRLYNSYFYTCPPVIYKKQHCYILLPLVDKYTLELTITLPTPPEDTPARLKESLNSINWKSAHVYIGQDILDVISYLNK